MTAVREGDNLVAYCWNARMLDVQASKRKYILSKMAVIDNLKNTNTYLHWGMVFFSKFSHPLHHRFDDIWIGRCHIIMLSDGCIQVEEAWYGGRALRRHNSGRSSVHWGGDVGGVPVLVSDVPSLVVAALGRQQLCARYYQRMFS